MIYFAHGEEVHADNSSLYTIIAIAAILSALVIAVAIGIYTSKKRAKTAQPDKETEIE